MRKSSRRLSVCLFLWVMIASCKQSDNKINSITVPINNTHINILSWDPKLKKVDGVFFYDGEAYTGELNNKLSDSNIKASAIILDGLLHGTLSEFYSNGQVRTEKIFTDGYENGSQKGWHSTGELSYDYTALRGVRDGLYQEYYPNGQLQVEAFYKNGIETKRKIKDIEGVVIVNYEIRDGRYYGLLGSSSCITVYEDDQYIKSYED